MGQAIGYFLVRVPVSVLGNLPFRSYRSMESKIQV